MNIEHPIYSL